jgi:hypothetical protein
MKTSLFVPAVLAAALITLPSFAQTPASSPNAPSIPSDSPVTSSTQPSTVATSPAAASGQPDQAEMMKQMTELAKLNENHKLLASMAGTWSYTVQMWMNPDPNAKPEVSKGTAIRKSMMNGRFFVTDVTGKMQMPGADGKMKDMTFKGMGIEGYDNVKKKFIGTWADNMGTGIMMSEGDYDPATKTFTYTGEYEAIPGMKQKIREVVKIVDKDHHVFEWYEDRGGQEAKTMEIAYTRKK